MSITSIFIVPNDLANQSSFVSRLISLLSKKINIPQALTWSVADEFRLTNRLEPFLTRVMRDDDDLMLFTCQGWYLVVRIREVIYKELFWEFFSTVCFDKASTN